MAIHFLTDEMWKNLEHTLFQIADQCAINRQSAIGIEASNIIMKSVERGENCQILYGLASLQVRSLVEGNRPAYEVATSAHDQVKKVMMQYEQHCHECDTINDTVYDENYKIYLCKSCQLSREG